MCITLSYHCISYHTLVKRNVFVEHHVHHIIYLDIQLQREEPSLHCLKFTPLISPASNVQEEQRLIVLAASLVSLNGKRNVGKQLDPQLNAQKLRTA